MKTKHRRQYKIITIITVISIIVIIGSKTYGQFDDKKDNGIKFGVYVNSGFFIELSDPNKYEIYSSAGVIYFPNEDIDILGGIFVSYINNKNLIITDKNYIIFPGVEIGVTYHPFKIIDLLDLYVSGNVAFTIWPGTYVRPSIGLGSRFHVASIFDIDIRYSFNYTTANELNAFLSHLFSIYLVFRI